MGGIDGARRRRSGRAPSTIHSQTFILNVGGGGNGIAINASMGDSVYLRELNIDGLHGLGANGIEFDSGGALPSSTASPGTSPLTAF
jgi:hypothetical protein